jgi:hypothetical protein
MLEGVRNEAPCRLRREGIVGHPDTAVRVANPETAGAGHARRIDLRGDSPAGEIQRAGVVDGSIAELVEETGSDVGPERRPRAAAHHRTRLYRLPTVPRAQERGEGNGVAGRRVLEPLLCGGPARFTFERGFDVRRERLQLRQLACESRWDFAVTLACDRGDRWRP